MTLGVKLSRAIALYMRLSRDDEGGESSMENQRAMLRAFVLEKGGSVKNEYADDGYSGATFDRPAFKKLLDDVRAGVIDTVIVKDLSRFGRNYIQAGRYLDCVFPALGIRFIAIEDGLDTADKAADTDMLPVINVFNEWHAATTSRKIRAALDAGRRAGKFTGARYPYGYLAAADDKRSAVIDGEAASAVRRIYDMRLSGLSAARIARELSAADVPNPATHRTRGNARTGKWSAKAVLRILSDRTYTGCVVQRKTERVSYKIKRVEALPPEEWLIEENAHTPIVDASVAERVRQMSDGDAPRGRADKNGRVHPLSGMLVCADCFKKLKYKRGGFVCRTYNDKGKRYCSSHYAPEKALEAVVLADVKLLVKRTDIDIAALKARFEREYKAATARRVAPDGGRVEEYMSRLREIDALLVAVCDRRACKNIPSDVCERLRAQYVRERENIRAEIAASDTSGVEEGAEEFVGSVVRQLELLRLTRELCLRLIRRVTVCEKRTDGSREIHIFYRFAAPRAAHDENGGECETERSSDE